MLYDVYKLYRTYTRITPKNYFHSHLIIFYGRELLKMCLQYVPRLPTELNFTIISGVRIDKFMCRVVQNHKNALVCIEDNGSKKCFSCVMYFPAELIFSFTMFNG